MPDKAQLLALAERVEVCAIAFVCGAALACLPYFAGELIDRAGLNPFAAPVAVVGRR